MVNREPVRKRCPGFAVGALTLLAVSPLAAQTDPSGSWRTWHTTHFRVHAQVRNALAEGVSPEAIRHAVLLGLTTLGFPATMAASSWVEDLLPRRGRSRRRKK